MELTKYNANEILSHIRHDLRQLLENHTEMNR